MRILILLLGLFALVPTVAAQPTEPLHIPGDTIHHREIVFALPDSTLFRYEAGEIRLISDGNYRFLTFIDSIGNIPDNYLISKTFTIGTTNDSILLSRFASFDDKDFINDSSVYHTKTQLDSAMAAREDYYSGREFSSAGGLYFNSTSAIRYIIELRSASDHRVLQRLDTLRCFLNANGKLRYRTPENTLNYVYKKLDAGIDSQVYIKVRIETDLPSATIALTYKGRTTTLQRPIPDGFMFASAFQEVPSIAPKRTGLRSSSHSMNMSVNEVYPNPASSRIHLGIQADAGGSILINLLDINGRPVYKKIESITAGFTRISLDVSTVASGVYALTVSNTKETLSHSVAIEKK